MANSTRVLEFVFLHFKVNEKLMIKVSLFLDQRLSRIKKTSSCKGGCFRSSHNCRCLQNSDIMEFGSPLPVLLFFIPRR